ncbi:MAG TPA: multicopper oxidase family protein [Microvirga sp.]|jgi:FtsP/CotA-like multicopper oxidase with cupredoxin domain|nr:multicopper oxidase family protein [Microvirga sp.]
MPSDPSAPTRRAVAAGLAVTLAGLRRPAWAQGGAAGAPPAAPPEPTLRAAPLARRLRPDAPGEAALWGLDGQVPGPVVRIRQGAELRLRLVNETPAPLALHWHGLRGPGAMDGVGGLTQAPVAPGQSFTYRFTPPDAGTFLIRPCVIGGTAEPLERGLSGILVVEETNPPPVDADIAVVIDDWRLAEDGALAPFGAPADAAAGRLGNWLTANARPVPERIEVAPGSRVRLRLVNAANARAMRVRFDGLKPYVAAVDSTPTDTFEPLRASLPFVPGSRYDLLVDMPEEAGAAGSIVALLGEGIPLVTLATAGEPAGKRRPALPPIGPLPRTARLPPAIRLQNAARKDVVLRTSLKPGQAPPSDPRGLWTVNGAPGTAGMPPLLSVKRGSPVVLALVNQTPAPQPFHLHGHAFRLLHPFDDGWEPYWLDTVLIPETKTVRIAFDADNPGKWLLESMVAERFDAGLWTWFEVT